MMMSDSDDSRSALHPSSAAALQFRDFSVSILLIFSNVFEILLYFSNVNKKFMKIVSKSVQVRLSARPHLNRQTNAFAAFKCHYTLIISLVNIFQFQACSMRHY
jgi:hypothetical protein